MNRSTQVIVKFSADNRSIQVLFSDQLIGSEAIVSGVISQSTPTGLTAVAQSHTDNSVTLNVAGGTSGQSYGVEISVNTDAGHVYSVVVAVVVDDNIASNYTNQNDVAFNALVGKLEAGTSAVGVANFMMPPGFQANGGLVEWTLLDQQGVVYAQGQAFDYDYQTVQSGVKIQAQAVIGAPSDMIPTLDGQAYQIRWTLTVNGSQTYSFEQLEIVSAFSVPEGVQDVVEIVGTQTIIASVVTDRPYDTITADLYFQNTILQAGLKASSIKVANGWENSAAIDGTQLGANLEPYTLMWNCSNIDRPNYFDRQVGRVFIINPSIIQATNDMKAIINKSYSSVQGVRDILFDVPLLLAYLRRGRDAFNIAYGMFTGFTMLNASGGIREYWLKFSEINALRAQFLAEGEKVFNFSGQAISLDVDRTSYYENLANTIQQGLDAEGKQVKQNLIKKGIISGDGNVDNLQQVRPGAIGHVGITITPATSWARYNGRFGPYGGGGGNLF